MAKVYVLVLLVLLIELANSVDTLQNNERLSVSVYNTSTAEIQINSNQFNFSAFTNLISLSLRINSKVNFTNLSGLDNLIYLNLSSNQISTMNLTNLHSLTALDLSNNSITNLSNVQLPSKLTTLNLTLNNITIKTNITFPENLTDLNMSSDHLTINDNVYFIGKIKKLDLTFNKITSTEPFANLTALEELYLSNNNITELKNTSFTKLSSLVLLDLGHNRITNLTSKTFTGLCHLQTLDLSDNLLLTMEPGTFQYIDNLINLKLRGNIMIGRFVMHHNSMLIETGQRLQTIDVTGTNITKVPVILTRSVRTLYAANNSISTLQRGDLDSYPLLQVLNLSRNVIATIEDDAIGRLEFLTELYLSNNQLKHIPHVLPDNLKILDVNSNKIEALTSNDFTGLSRLKELTLRLNSIQVINDETFGQLTSLEFLDLSENPIKILSSSIFIGPRKLKRLTLTHLYHLLPTQEPLSFPVPESGHLESLNLASSPVLANQLLDDVAALTMFHQLFELDLSDANLTEIRSDLFRFLPRLRKLNLNGNVLNCTGILWLSKWYKGDREDVDVGLQILHEQSLKDLNSKRTLNVTIPICSFPDHLKGRSLFNLSENDFPEMSFTETVPTAATILSSTTAIVTTQNYFTAATESNTTKHRETKDTTNQHSNFNTSNIKNNKTVQQTITLDSNRTIENNLRENRTVVSTYNQTKVTNKNKTIQNTFNTSHKDNHFFNATINKNTSVLVLSNETLRVAGKPDAFSAEPTGSHPGMLVFLTVLCVLVFASVIMILSHWTQYRKRKELTRGYIQQQDIEVLSLSSAGINDLW